VFCICSTRYSGLASMLNGVTAQQEMCGQTIAGSQMKDDLSHLYRIAGLLAPIKLRRLGYRAHRRLIIREQFGRVLVRANAPVRSHAARFGRTYLDAKRGHFLSKSLRESPNRPLGRMVPGVPGTGQATTHSQFIPLRMDVLAGDPVFLSRT
jgi:hypothetical protein